MTSSAFAETLKSITTTKLKEISKKRQIFEGGKTSIEVSVQKESNQWKRVSILFHGVKNSFAVKTLSQKRGRQYEAAHNAADQGLAVMLQNLERFLEQARYDPTISSKLLLEWENSLAKRLNVQSLKYQYATLYGELVNDWLTSEQGHKDTYSMDIDGYEVMDKAEKHEARKNWEKAVFEPLHMDEEAIASYLRSLFKKADPLKALAALRKRVREFETELSASDQFNDVVLKWTINGLLSSGLLSEQKNQVLKDFLGSPVILAEIADVLNMRIVSIENWGWEQEYIPVEQRRHMNGNYHIYIDEDLLEAIFLQYIGIRWSVFFKAAFTTFSKHEGAWESLRKPTSREELTRREYFLGKQLKEPSVQSKRQDIHSSYFFMAQLPTSAEAGSVAVAGEEEANYDDGPRKRARMQQIVQGSMTSPPGSSGPPQLQQKMQQSHLQAQLQARQAQQAQQAQQAAQAAWQPPQLNRAMMQQQQQGLGFQNYPSTGAPRYHHAGLDEYDMEDDNPFDLKSPMEKKQFLLHILSAEILLGTSFHNDFTCTRSEFESWSPTLPHSTIRSVLSYFGISQKWLGFFKTFLEAPLKFVEDGPYAETRTRKRGVPGAHSLSSMCGEVVLFILDYAVNQSTKGAQLYRMHDDFWLWSSSHDTVVKGWEAITNFTEVMGVTLNERKTGTVRIRDNQSITGVIHSSLPEGSIRWGFLILDPTSGKFVIDQKMVDKHIDELERQLQGKKSVFSWIQAWNTYAGTFFKSNFGKPANCFGRQHVDMMLEAMTRIQTRIFGDSNVVEHLKSTIEAKFGVTDIPDGYLYFPTSLGGLDLQNPFIGTVQVRSSVCEQPSSLVQEFLAAEREAYRLAKKKFDRAHAEGSKGGVLLGTYVPADNAFLSFEEFCHYREDFSASWKGNLLGVYEELLRRPRGSQVQIGNELGMSTREMVEMNPDLDDEYLRWVVMLYGKEMVERFGGISIVDKGLLPVGMVNLFRSGRIRWQG